MIGCAMECQKKIAAKIVEKHADYLLALKENHPTLYAEVVAYFDIAADQKGHRDMLTFAETEDRNHGRTYRRYYEDTPTSVVPSRPPSVVPCQPRPRGVPVLLCLRRS